MKFIIIHDERTKRMADVLSANISQNENIETVVWTEKQYEDNKVELSSHEYRLFLGETENGNNLLTSPNFITKFEKFNMKYGWLGKHAVLKKDKAYNFTNEELDGFSELYNRVFKNEISLKKETQNQRKNKVKEVVQKIDDKIKKVPLIGKVAAVAVGVPFMGLFGTIVAVTSSTYIVKGMIDQKKIAKDSENLLLQVFFNDGLSDFLKEDDK